MEIANVVISIKANKKLTCNKWSETSRREHSEEGFLFNSLVKLDRVPI